MITFALILVFLGGFSLGFMLSVEGPSGRTVWRIEWIKLEHDSARKEGREPRDIGFYERTNKKTLGK